MIEKIFRKFLKGWKRRPFGAWQIELTTRCPLLCKMCIRTETREWQYQDMALEDFKKILPHLKEVETVVLEGWGESLLHKNLAECVRLVKQEGPEVGFVTCGMGLTTSRASELLDAGLDFVGFSISGIKQETHDAIRVNSRLPEVLNAIRFLREEKDRRGQQRPRIHMVFLMVKDNIREVPSVPAFAREAGIEQVVLINICHMINPWQEQQRVFVWGSDDSEYEAILKETEDNARRLRVKLSRPSFHAVDVAVCDENPLRNLYISAEGEVSPCVYLFPALSSPFKRLFCGKEYFIDRITFGNIFRDSFPVIWNGEGYRQFRGRFQARSDKFRELYSSLFGQPTVKGPGSSTLPDPPEPCKTCHKIIGV